jgi:hypothetical protein
VVDAQEQFCLSTAPVRANDTACMPHVEGMRNCLRQAGVRLVRDGHRRGTPYRLQLALGMVPRRRDVGGESSLRVTKTSLGVTAGNADPSFRECAYRSRRPQNVTFCNIFATQRA